MSFFTILDAFKTTNSLANAKKVAAHVRKHPMVMTMLTEDDAGMVREAERTVADAKDPAKIREAMQQELQARFKSLNITVI
jgi:uncharacterized protein (DUF2249 family)